MTTYCKRGHERTPENVTRDRACRTCRSAAEAAKRARTYTPKTPADAARHACNVRGVIHYIERRRQRLARQERSAA